jgi:hypothetical protein
MAMMFVGVVVGVVVGGIVGEGRAMGAGALLLPGRKAKMTTTSMTTAAIISIRSDGGGGRGRFAGGADGGATSGMAPTACMEASSVA